MSKILELLYFKFIGIITFTSDFSTSDIFFLLVNVCLFQSEELLSTISYRLGMVMVINSLGFLRGGVRSLGMELSLPYIQMTSLLGAAFLAFF